MFLDHVDPSNLVENYRGKIPITKFKMGKQDFEVDKERYRKFLIVREPMERLASCYNDKMIVNPARILYDWRKRVKNKADQIKGVKFSIHDTVSFDDFLTAVVIPKDEKGKYNSILQDARLGYDFNCFKIM